VKAAFCDIAGLRTRYFISGTGPLLVLVHPVGYPAEIWTRNIDALSTSFTVIAPDLPGQGHSEAPARWEVPPHWAMAEHLVRLVELLGHEQFSVVGSSMGGQVAATLALRYPQQVERLVLVGTGSVFNNPNAQADVLRAVYANGSRAYADPSLAACRARIANTCFRPPDAEDILLTQLTAYALPGAAAAYKALIDRLIETVEATEYLAYPQLERITAPALVIIGREDKRSSVEAHRAGALRMADARITVYDECGHLPYLEHATRFNADLELFLKGEAVGAHPANLSSNAA